MSRNAFKLRDTDEFSEGYYLGYKSAVYDNLFTGMAYGEGQEIRRYFSQF